MKNLSQSAFALILLFVAAVALPRTAEAVDGQILTLDRESASYLFNLPPAYSKECLIFTWVLQSSPSFQGELAVLQFSYDQKEWRNLANSLLDYNGTANGQQPIDSSWARKGSNYLRVIVRNEASNIVHLTVNHQIGYWILWPCLFVFPPIAFLWYSLKKAWIREPMVVRKLRAAWQKALGREIWLILLMGLLIRILIAPFTEQRFDSYVSRLWPTLPLGYGLYPFEPMMPSGYPLILRYSLPPLSFFASGFLFSLWRAITVFRFPVDPQSLWKYGIDVGNVFESYRSFIPPALPLLDLMLKIPSILADIGVAYLLFSLARTEKQKGLVVFLWILNPFVIQISSIWGAADSIAAFFSLCFLYFMIKKRFLLSAISVSLGAGIKLYPLFFLVPSLIYVYRTEDQGRFFRFLSAVILSCAFVFGTFLIFPGGFEFLLRLFFFKASPDWYGKNLFAGLTWLRFFSVFQWGGNIPIFLVIFCPVYLWLCYICWKNKNDRDSLAICSVSILLLSYLSYTVVNPQYILWVLPILLYLHFQGRFSKRLFVMLSLIPLIYVYGYYNPLQFVSPVIVWQEWNYPPISDVILQLWPYVFSDVTLDFLAMCLFPFVVLLSFLSVIQNRVREKQVLVHAASFASRLTENVNAAKRAAAAIVIPTLNEKENVVELVRGIGKIKDVNRVIIVDDGSTDGTADLINDLSRTDPNILLIQRRGSKGIGGAIKEGITKSLTLDPLPDYIITMDADLSHDPRVISRLIEHSVKSKCHITIASRYVSGGTIEGWSFHRKVLSISANTLARLVLQVPVKDCTSGFKCYQRHAIQALLPLLEGEAYEFQVETLHKAKRNRLTLTEIPTTFSERRNGKSKLGKKEIWRFLLYLIRNALR